MAIDLHCSEYGEGAPILLLHGLFGSGVNFRSIARQLSARYRAVTVDLRNHGESPHAPSMDYPSMAEDVLALLDRLDFGRATLLGHSMGGKAAMLLALQHPERVEKLAVVDIAPGPSEADHLPLVDAMQNLDLDRVASRSQADRDLTESIPEAGVRRFLLQNLVSSGNRYRWRINLDAIESSMGKLLDFPDIAPGTTYSGPTLFLRGEKSYYVRPEHHARIHELFPHSTIESIAGAGHWVHADQPRAFLAAVEKFLSA